MDEQLDRFQLWMVKRNLEYAKSEGIDTVVNRLKSNGYLKVANAVANAFRAQLRDGAKSDE